jgi:quercetin dioxygenase-like cupin family protein
MSERIFEKGKRLEKYFTGSAYIKFLTSANVLYDCQVYDVYFESGARNNWHLHEGEGQILLCTQGVGFYQEWGKPARRLVKGDVVEIPPNTKHWHGAAPDSDFTHIGISTDVSKNVWLEPVSDEQYAEAVGE